MDDELDHIRRRLAELVELRRIGEVTSNDLAEYRLLTEREEELLGQLGAGQPG